MAACMCSSMHGVVAPLRCCGCATSPTQMHTACLHYAASSQRMLVMCARACVSKIPIVCPSKCKCNHTEHSKAVAGKQGAVKATMSYHEQGGPDNPLLMIRHSNTCTMPIQCRCQNPSSSHLPPQLASTLSVRACSRSCAWDWALALERVSASQHSVSRQCSELGSLWQVSVEVKAIAGT